MVKNSSAKARDVGLVLGREDSPGGENDNPRQYSCRRSLAAHSPWGCAESDVTERTYRGLLHSAVTTGHACKVFSFL